MKKTQNPLVVEDIGNLLNGFSLVEVLIAFSILAIVLASVFESRLKSIRQLENTNDLNRLQNTVRVDLASIREQALKWQCVQGTACSGLYEDKDNEARYHNINCAAFDNSLGDFPVRTQVLISQDNNIGLTREVEIKGKQLKITYNGQARGKPFTTTASIIPQAMNWCS